MSASSPRDETDEGRPSRYELLLTDEAFYAYASLPSDSLFARVDHDLDLLRSFPELGKKYDPEYDAALPPFDCGVLYCGQYGIYCRVDDDSRRVVVFAIVDQRRNPKTRFDGYEYGAVGLG